MRIAITRAVSPSISACELSFKEREPIDAGRAAAQHRCYEACLESLGLRVIALPAEPAMPDAVFVEDPVVVVDEVAVIARPGAESRRPEAATLARAIAPYRPLRWMPPGATLDGGDVLRAGRRLFAGLSLRTNPAGIQFLAEVLSPFGYTVHSVGLRDCLHLKSAVSALDEETLLVHRPWFDAAALSGYRLVDVPSGECWAANVLAIDDTIVMADGFPGTRAILERLGWKTRLVDVSELMKAEAGVTCCSIIFDAPG